MTNERYFEIMLRYVCRLNQNKLFLGGSKRYASYCCKLLIIGGGTGGCTIASKLSKKLPSYQIIVVEPKTTHIFQSSYLLVGAGMECLPTAFKPTQVLLPKSVVWMKDYVTQLVPQENIAYTSRGDDVKYEIVVIAVGLEPNFDEIPGLVEALDMPGYACSNYSLRYVEKTYDAIQNFNGGNAIFTSPRCALKCPGSQFNCFFADHYFRKRKRRKDAIITYNTASQTIIDFEPYCEVVETLCKCHEIEVNTNTELVEVKHSLNQAVFKSWDACGEREQVFEYSLLHVAPPMYTPNFVRYNKQISDEYGFVRVNPYTLQHEECYNVFAIGDCASVPSAKTAVAVAFQANVLYKNILAAFKGKKLKSAYNGYSYFPIITKPKSCVVLESWYIPKECKPKIKASRISWYFHRHVFPKIYWKQLLKGKWKGPRQLQRRIRLTVAVILIALLFMLKSNPKPHYYPC